MSIIKKIIPLLFIVFFIGCKSNYVFKHARPEYYVAEPGVLFFGEDLVPDKKTAYSLARLLFEKRYPSKYEFLPIEKGIIEEREDGKVWFVELKVDVTDPGYRSHIYRCFIHKNTAAILGFMRIH